MATGIILVERLKPRRRGISKAEEAIDLESGNRQLTTAGIPTNRKRKRSRRASKRKFWFVFVGLFTLSAGCLVVLSSSVAKQIQQPHAIPNIVIFTHRYNLLEVDIQDLHIGDEADRLELEALQANVQHSIDLHPGAQVRFLTDDDCVESIKDVLGKDTKLVDHFRAESQGMFKADICRGAALAQTGGLYFDVDLGVRMNIFDALQFNTTFSTVRVHFQSDHKGAFFQAFMGSTANHPVILRYIQLFLDYYEGRLGEIKGPLGVLLLRKAFDEILDEQDEDGQEEKSEKENQLSTAEVWQEVFYVKDLHKTLLKHIPPPTWGARRACNFIVISNAHDPVTVPFYSRIAGSRMCPVNETATA